MGAVPEHLRSADERYWLEQAKIDEWIASLEAGETPRSRPITGEWSTVQEIAARHRCSPKTIRKRIHDGSLKAEALNPSAPARQRRWRVHRKAEEAWIKQKGQRVRETAARRAPKTKSGKSFKELVQR